MFLLFLVCIWQKYIWLIVIFLENMRITLTVIIFVIGIGVGNESLYSCVGKLSFNAYWISIVLRMIVAYSVT